MTAGGVAILPLDVAYAVIGTTAEAIRTIFAAKNRSYDKPSGMFATWQLSRELHVMPAEHHRIAPVIVHRREIARARTFGMLRDVEKLWKLGFALGSSLENSIAVDEDRVLNPGGLRSSDEFVCHKMLDAVGDLALAGAPIVGTYRAFCPGHRMNLLVLQAMFADRSSFQFIEAPARAEPSFADFALAPMLAFAAEAN